MKLLSVSAALLAATLVMTGCDKKAADDAANSVKAGAEKAADKAKAGAKKAVAGAGKVAEKAATGAKEVAKAAGDTAVKAVDSVGNAGSAAIAKTEAALNAGGALMNPAQATATAPDKFTVKLDTTQGEILIDVTRDWSPQGADRFYNLVKIGYYNDVAFFRVIDNFMAQVGINGKPEVNKVWREARIKDDPVKGSNTRGMVTFAMAGPNTRTTQFFVNFKDNSNLDAMRFSPFGKVQDSSMKVLDSIHKGYGEGAPRGRGPAQGRAQMEGNAYLKKDFPELDYIKTATIQK